MQENKKLWFKRKQYGWGWVPCSWQGWVTVLFYVLAMVIYQYTIRNTEPDGNFLVGVVFPVFIFTSILIFICYKKGEAPKWQWGNNNQK